MNKKDNLLSIGDMSKYSGASIRSLRYYEKMKILTPAYVDESSGYRYYGVEQLHHIWIIMFCIEVGIPLKELAKDETINIRDIVKQGKELAEAKLKTIQSGMRLFESVERQIRLTEKYAGGEIYTRETEEKTFLIKPCGNIALSELDIIKAFMEMPLDDSAFDGIMEYGLLYEHTPGGTERYIFTEVPRDMEAESKKIIPAGINYCCISQDVEIDQAAEIFKAQLAGRTSFFAIETEIFTDKFEPGKPFFSELRVTNIV
jgi:DNA-binding transcriptional MerR regulator